MQGSERRCRFSARPKSLAGQGIQPRSVAPQGSWEIGMIPSNLPLKAVAWVQIPSGLQARNPSLAGVSARSEGCRHIAWGELGARVVGVHPSTVSLHRRNHTLPRMAMAVATESTEIASASLVREHDRAYGLALMVLENALAQDDLRLARDMITEIRKLLVVITDLQKAIAKGTLSDALAQQIGAQPDREAVRATFEAKLDALRDSYLRARRYSR